MPLPPKVCPECHDEYLHQTTVCVHCDVELVLHDELPDNAPSSLPEASELECVRVATSGWSVGLAERLREAHIPHRVELVQAPGGATQTLYGLFVLAEDLAAAREIDAGHARREMPDLPEGFDPADMMAGPASDPEEGEAGCPACGDPFDAEAEECPGCGLFLGAAG